MQRQRGDASATLRAKKRDDLAANLGPRLFFLFRLHARNCFEHALVLHRFEQVLGTTGPHSGDNPLWLRGGRHPEYIAVGIFRAQSLRDPDRFFRILVVVNDADAGLCTL